MKFTDKFVSNLKPEEKQFYKREADGFTIRVLPSGIKTWLFIYTIAGKRRQMNLGEYPTISLAKARERFLDARLALREGKDPQDAGFEWHKNPERERREATKRAEEDLKNLTVAQLADHYMERHAKIFKKESSWTEDARLLKKNVLPLWGDRKAKDIRKQDCILLLETFLKKGPALSNNILKLTRKMFNFGVEKALLEFTPFTGVKAPAPVKERERTLSESEIRALWNTELPKASMSPEVKRILKLILVTGQRPNEVAGIHRGEIEGRWWTIPREAIYSAEAKNSQTHRVYLTDLALELIGDKQGYIFESPRGNKPIDENAVAYAVRKNLKNYVPRRPLKYDEIRMVKVKEERKMAIAHFTPHDLRRTMSTFLAQIRISDEVNDAVLNHKKRGVIRIYNRYNYDPDKKKALTAWERKLKAIITKACPDSGVKNSSKGE